jgi:hypothetical protein
MRKYLIAIGTFAILTFASGCKKDGEFLDRQPTDVLSVEAVWRDPNLVQVSRLSNYRKMG